MSGQPGGTRDDAETAAPADTGADTGAATAAVTSGGAVTGRYDNGSVLGRRAALAVVALLVAALAGWLVWATWLTADPKVTSELQSFDVQSDHTVSAVLQVHLASGATGVSCTVQAIAADHSVVGEVDLHPDPSDGEELQFDITTDRRATAVQSEGCTATGQDRPR